MKIATVATTLEITVNAASSQAKGTKSTSFKGSGLCTGPQIRMRN